jgi:hypothetical protein
LRLYSPLGAVRPFERRFPHEVVTNISVRTSSAGPSTPREARLVGSVISRASPSVPPWASSPLRLLSLRASCTPRVPLIPSRALSTLPQADRVVGAPGFFITKAAARLSQARR